MTADRPAAACGGGECARPGARDDVPDLPRLPVANYTVGRTYGDQDGRRFRPSLFLTLTLPSYGPMDGRGAADRSRQLRLPAGRPGRHPLGKLTDRFMQNLCRAVGWNVQYFTAVEAQHRGVPHLHAAIRGTTPRKLLRQVAAATYHQM
jgi:hypothetical protein